MLGLLLVGIGQLFAEVSTSLGKYDFAKKRESLYAFGFLSHFWATIFLLALGFYRDAFIFSLESLPTFSLRMLLEIILMYVGIHAVMAADRSTFAFLHTLTVPLLLGADIVLGYVISLTQMVGIALMVSAIVVLTLNNGLSRRGKLLSLFSALIPVATLSLYKYNITYFNSVEAEQALQHFILLSVVVIVAWYRTRENLFAYLVHPKYFTQALSAGAGMVFMSYAYYFAPASIITAGKRAFEVLGAIIFGRQFFSEKHIMVKLTAFILIAAGVMLLVM